MKFKHIPIFLIACLPLGAASQSNSQSEAKLPAVISHSSAGEGMSFRAKSSAVCQALAGYPRAPGAKMAFEIGEISPICKPFVNRSRSGLDMCGDTSKDPYASGTTESFDIKSLASQAALASRSTSSFTWPSRLEMYKRGQINVFTDPKGEPFKKDLEDRAEKIRNETTAICCNGDVKCEDAMKKVQVNICKPSVGEKDPDSCVYGGVYQVPAEEFALASTRLMKTESGGTFSPATGNITLSSYVSATNGAQSVDSVIRHEFGHACSMVKMQLTAASPFWQKILNQDQRKKAERAKIWVEDVKDRCVADAKLPEAYYDFWESVGESKEFAGCLYKLAELNQKQAIDRTCEKLCPGHYLEEAVGITFSLLTGDLSGQPGAVFPNTCNHVRDAQHPMVSDVMDCLTQYSPRFRDRLRKQYSCDDNVNLASK